MRQLVIYCSVVLTKCLISPVHCWGPHSRNNTIPRMYFKDDSRQIPRMALTDMSRLEKNKKTSSERRVVGCTPRICIRRDRRLLNERKRNWNSANSWNNKLSGGGHAAHPPVFHLRLVLPFRAARRHSQLLLSFLNTLSSLELLRVPRKIHSSISQSFRTRVLPRIYICTYKCRDFLVWKRSPGAFLYWNRISHFMSSRNARVEGTWHFTAFLYLAKWVTSPNHSVGFVWEFEELSKE